MDSQEKKHTRDIIHGPIYQLKLLILFLYGGIENKYSFRLGTEIDEANKFDDLMFQYTHENKQVIRLLQAKHRKDERKRITADALLTEADGDFSLIKYFFSFQDLKESYPEGSIRDVIICTNVDFDSENLKRAKISVEEIKDEDEIVDIICTGTNRTCMRYRFCKNVGVLLKPKLESYHLTKLARRLVKCILEGSTMQQHQKTDIFLPYHLILTKDVIDTKNRIFQSKFIKNENLSPTTKRFRDLFESELKEKTENKLNLKEINAAIADASEEKRKIKIVLSKNFGVFNKKIGQGSTEEQGWPQTVISDSTIDEFLNHLVFAVNQPNEEELGDILKRKIGNGFNYITTQYLYDKVFQSMLELLQGKKERRFLTHLEGKEMLDVAIKEISPYPAFQYENELRLASFERNIQFREWSVVQNFLSSEKGIWQVQSETPWLSSLVIYQELSRSSTNFRYLFLPWNYLQENPTIISYFKEIELMIIICSLTDDKHDEKSKTITESIAIRLIDSKQVLKKLIYIASDHQAFKKVLTSNNIQLFQEKLAVCFSDLTDVSQELLMEAKIIRLQGSPTKQSIKEILDLGMEQLLADKIKDLNLDATALEILLRYRNHDIFEKQPTLSDVQSLHYKPNSLIKMHQIRKALEANLKDIFALMDSENQIVELLPDKQDELYNFKDIVSAFKPNIHRFILLDTNKGQEQYKELCYLIDILIASEASETEVPALHLLKHTESGWLRLCTYNRNIYVQRNFCPIAVGQHILRDLLFKDNCGFKIISGIATADLLNLLEITDKADISTVNRTSLILHDVDPDLENLLCKIRKSFQKNDNEHNVRSNLNDSLLQPVTVRRNFDFISTEIEEREISSTTVHSIILVKHFRLLNDIQRCNSNLKQSEKSVHWFKACTDDCNFEIFHWHRSEGDISKIRKIIEKTTTHLLTEGNLANSKQRIILLAGEPGAGKSITLTHIAEAIKREKPVSLVIKMELKRYKELLTLKYWSSLSDVLHFLSFLDGKTKNNPLAQKLFRYLLNHTDGVILLFDGFDELSLREQDCALSLFQTIKTRTKATMWIATRRNDHSNIERELSVLAYTFEPCNRNLQVAILTKFWDTALKFSNQCSTEGSVGITLEKQAKEILDCFQCSLGEAENINNPLTIRMIAEMNLEKLKNLDNNIFSEYFYSGKGLGIENIYCEFVDKKYDIYLHEKLNIVNTEENSETVALIKRGYTKAYGLLAVKSIFHDYGINAETKKETLSIDLLLKIGLLEGSVNAVNFVHRTFAEYFTTELITRKLKSAAASEQQWSFVLNDILMCYNGRKFFDDKLKNDKEVAQLLDISQNKDTVFRLILEQSRNVYSVLWYAAVDNLENTLDFLLKSAKSFDCLKKISVHLFRYEISNEETCCKLLIKCILKFGKELDAHRLAELIVTEEYNILYQSVFWNNQECVDMIFNSIEDSDKIFEILKWNASYHNFGRTALHIAFEKSNLDIVEKCIAKLDPTQLSRIFNIRDSFNVLPSNYSTGDIKQIVNSRYKQYIEDPQPKIDGLIQKRDTICQNLLKYIDYAVSDFRFFHLLLEPYLPAFERRKTSRRGAIITRLFSQFLFLTNTENIEMIRFIERFYRYRSLMSSERRPQIHSTLVNLLTILVSELDSADQSLPSNFVIHRGYKNVVDLRRYISEEIGESTDFAIHLRVASHVLAVYRINEKYIYFDSGVCAVFRLKHIDDTLKVLEKDMELSAYQIEEGGFLVEHFNAKMANTFLEKKECKDFMNFLSCLESHLQRPKANEFRRYGF